MVTGVVVHEDVSKIVSQAVMGRYQEISINSGELKQVIQLCRNNASKRQVREALSLFRVGNREAIRSFLKKHVPENWHELIDTYPIGEIPVASEVRELVARAMENDPMSRYECCRRDLQEVIQRCWNGDSEGSVERSLNSLKRAGKSPEPIIGFLLNNTPKRYHKLLG